MGGGMPACDVYPPRRQAACTARHATTMDHVRPPHSRSIGSAACLPATTRVLLWAITASQEQDVYAVTARKIALRTEFTSSLYSQHWLTLGVLPSNVTCALFCTDSTATFVFFFIKCHFYLFYFTHCLFMCFCYEWRPSKFIIMIMMTMIMTEIHISLYIILTLMTHNCSLYLSYLHSSTTRIQDLSS